MASDGLKIKLSSRGGLEVELWTDNSLPSALVDQIPLGAMYLYGTIWTRYINKVYRRVLYIHLCFQVNTINSFQIPGRVPVSEVLWYKWVLANRQVHYSGHDLNLFNHSKSGHVRISDPHCISFNICRWKVKKQSWWFQLNVNELLRKKRKRKERKLSLMRRRNLT